MKIKILLCDNIHSNYEKLYYNFQIYQILIFLLFNTYGYNHKPDIYFVIYCHSIDNKHFPTGLDILRYVSNFVKCKAL